ncbi:GspE/PulE family protein, partial [candidate division KSB1 bacterium]|nr:GspE/PulE family protein [candidate division KSB1 bacterium]NIT72105.1 GspE/PulE family protein [candidate division KSB1 bacterium]NIX71785.1 GAF domain-containing protein [candidate division KSB1 bacterium]
MPLIKKNSPGVPRKTDGRTSASQEKPSKELRKKTSGRRVSDRLKPLLSKIVSVVASESINEAFFNLTDEIKEFFECQSLVIYSVDAGKKQLFSRNLISEVIEEKRVNIVDTNLPGYVFKRGISLNIKNAYDKNELNRYPGLSHDPFWDRKIGIKTQSAIVVPVSHNSKTVGVLEIINYKGKATFSDQMRQLAEDLAESLGSALEKLEQEEEKDILQGISLAIQEASVMEDILFETTKPMSRLFNSEVVNIFALDHSRNEIYSRIKTTQGIKERRVSISPKSIVGWVALERRMVNIDDVNSKESLARYHPDLVYDNTWDMDCQIPSKAMLCCPMIHEGRLMGVVQVINTRRAERFAPHHERNIIAIAQMLAIAFHNNSRFAKSKPHKFSYLINSGAISPEELEASMIKARRSKIDLETILLEERGIKRADLGKSLSNYYGVPYFGYSDSTILPKKYFEGLNKNYLIKHHWVPIQNDNNLVIVLIDDPADGDKVRNIKMTFPKKEIQFKVGLRADIIDYLVKTPSGEMHDDDDDDDSHMDSENISSLLESMISETDDSTLVEMQDDEEESAISERDSSIVRLVNKIITDAYDHGVSDIHIEPGVGKEQMLVRYRKEGECGIVQEIPNIYRQALISRIKIMSKLDIAERRLPQDGKIKMKYGKKEIELRVATCPTVGGNEDVVMRILAASKPLPLDKMNFSERNGTLIKASVKKPYGLILVVGPTGSGKTTTLHSALGFINTPKKKIWTAEDPVEITQRGLRQVQMHNKIGLDFARAMRSFLRGDPDVIMVGEMRDVETCSIGLEASLTGHLVFSTLHTNSAPETITRLIDMGMNPINFADALILIVAQRLVKTLCKHCKKDYH